VARPATPRRPADRRPGRLDRPAQQHLPDDAGSAAAPGSGPPGDGPPVPAAPLCPTDEAPSGGLTLTAFWALLPPADRERLGLRLSRLVLKAVCAPESPSQEDA
jgi:hypothetical protein